MAGSFTRPKPSLEAAARGNVQDRLALDRHFDERIADLEKKSGGNSFNLTTAKPVATPPQPAQIQVQTVPGRFIVQLDTPTNKANAPLQHIIETSDSPSFSKVDTIAVGAGQKYIEISKYGAGVSKYIRVRTSADGTTFSAPRSAGLHSA